MKRATFHSILAAAGLVLAAAAHAQSLPTYTPQQRLRTPLDTCLKTEVLRDAYCVQKCSAGFRMQSTGGKPTCVGLSPGAKHEPKKPSFTPAEGTRKAPPPGA